ncbi:MAG: hypothetical protein GX181_02505 [Synergistaceae bacterium]|nr:hypothetical protein [Synergistota bacterium]NLM70819.1 hypothetical protein [Synergistaceae bacterium]
MAFSLVELLVALCISGALFGALALGGANLFGSPSPETTRREAERAASWLQRVHHRALLSKRGFDLEVLPYISNTKIVVYWADARKETFNSGGKAYFLNHAVDQSRCRYSPVWNTLTPALTIRVGASKVPRKSFLTEAYIIVSPFMRISVTSSPP